MTFVIAIDGPAAAGKGTLAKALAKELDLAYLDTGILYRAVGIKAAAAHILDQAGALAASLTPQDLSHPDLRRVEAGEYASKVAAQPEVRQALFAFQRAFGRAPPEDKVGAVLDGRDIGTVIFPEAAIKFFITAHPEVRARRRYVELDPATRPTFAVLLSQVEERDRRDSSRKDAPLRMAADAQLIDTSDKSPAEVLNLALSIVTKSL